MEEDIKPSTPMEWKDPQMANWLYRYSRPIWYHWDPEDRKKAKLWKAWASVIILIIASFVIIRLLL